MTQGSIAGARSSFSARREVRRGEEQRARLEREAAVLKRLDYLSAEEIDYLADCLRKNEQSFLAYAHSPTVANLMAKGLVATPGGKYHMDHYPYLILDFAWEALLARKDEFITKDDEHKRKKAEAEKEWVRRRGY
jgi:hypothetical protein